MEEVQRIMYAFGGITIVNAIPSWLGGAMAINLKVFAGVRICKNRCLYQSKLIETIVRYFRARYSLQPFEVDIHSEIPPMSGLKSSSAVAVATIRAIIDRFGLDEPCIPRLASELSREAGVSITGALDDAAAAYYGGAVLTDNLNMKIIRLFEPPHEVVAIIAVRGFREVYIDVRKLRIYSHVFYDIFLKALEGSIFEAMKLNGLAVAKLLGYNELPIIEALSRGALAAGISGNGPSMFAICKKGDEHYFVDVFSRYYDDVRIVDIVGVGGYESIHRAF